MGQKTQFIADYLRDILSATELCELCGISRKTGYKWIDRYKIWVRVHRLLSSWFVRNIKNAYLVIIYQDVDIFRRQLRQIVFPRQSSVHA